MSEESPWDKERRNRLEDLKRMGVSPETLKGMERIAAQPVPVIPDMMRVEFSQTHGSIRKLDNGGFVFEFCLPAIPFVKFYIPFDRDSLRRFGGQIMEATANEDANSTA